MRGLHKSIKISFMVVGHTKFSPDWCFGLLKKRFRLTKVNTLDDLVQVVQTSAAVNEAQLVGSQAGEPIVTMYGWLGLLGPRLKKIPLITKQHHFEIMSTSPQSVLVKEFNDSDEKEYFLTSDLSIAEELPEIIIPPGLSLQRKWYLYDKIREFCSLESRDLVCPRPDSPCPRATPQPMSPQQPPSLLQLQPSMENSQSVLQKRGRVCGNCGQTGHNKRTCHQSSHEL